MRKLLSIILSLSLVLGAFAFSAPITVSAEGEYNVIKPDSPVNNDRKNYTYLTSNANTPVEGFLSIGNGFSNINAVNENLGNGVNLLGQTATTDEVAMYVDMGGDYDVSYAMLYQGSTNNSFRDSYCKSYSIYVSTETVDKTNKGAITWVKAGECNNGTIYNGSGIYKTDASLADQASTGDTINFTDTFKARSIKVVYDKESCMGTGNSTGGGRLGTTSILSFRVFGVPHEEESTESPTEVTQAPTQTSTTTQAPTQVPTEQETIVNSDGDDTLYGSGTTNLAQGKNGYASSNDRQDKNYAVKVGNLTDNNTNSYIVTHSQDSTPWFAVDLGSVQDVNKIRIVPGGNDAYTNAYPISYEIQVAPEIPTLGDNAANVANLSWTTVKTVTGGTLSTQDTTFAHQSTKWIRVKVNSFNTSNCSLFELYVYATDKTKPYDEPTTGQQPTTTEAETIINSDGDENMYGSGTTDLAQGQKGYASSNDRGSHVNSPLKVSYLTDGSENSFIVTHDDDQSPWFATDLGSVQDVNKVKIVPGATGEGYESSYPISYEIQVSNRNQPIGDNEASLIPGFTWTTVATVTDGSLSNKEITFPHQTTRWLRIKVNTHNTQNCSLKELYVYETDKTTPYVEPTEPVDILFIGNSMTYYNTICKVVEGLANHKGKNINCTAVTNGGQNLIYQSTASNVDTAIKVGGYEVVILQDIVSSFNASNLQTGAQACINKIKQYNPDAEIVFYEPFPRKNAISNPGSRLPEFTYAYIDTASYFGADLAPAGEAFYDVYTNYGLDYYCTADSLHPQPLGTFINASTILYTLFPDLANQDYTSAEQDFLDNLINTNVAYTDEGVQDSYSLETLNLLNAKGYKYAHAVNSAMDTDANYTSIADEAYEEVECEISIDGDVVDHVNTGDIFTVPNTYELGYMDANDNDKVYKPGSTVYITDDLSLTAIKTASVVSDQSGASARMLKSNPGLAFEATISVNGSKPIVSDGFTYGIVLAPDDIRTEYFNGDLRISDDPAKLANVEFNSESDFYDFDEGVIKAGVMKIKEFNLNREFISRAYMRINYTDGSSRLIYSENCSAKRSVAGVATAIKADTAYYNSLSANERDAIDYFASFAN